MYGLNTLSSLILSLNFSQTVFTNFPQAVLFEWELSTTSAFNVNYVSGKNVSGLSWLKLGEYK